MPKLPRPFRPKKLSEQAQCPYCGGWFAHVISHIVRDEQCQQKHQQKHGGPNFGSIPSEIQVGSTDGPHGQRNDAPPDASRLPPAQSDGWEDCDNPAHLPDEDSPDEGLPSSPNAPSELLRRSLRLKEQLKQELLLKQQQSQSKTMLDRQQALYPDALFDDVSALGHTHASEIVGGLPFLLDNPDEGVFDEDELSHLPIRLPMTDDVEDDDSNQPVFPPPEDTQVPFYFPVSDPKYKRRFDKGEALVLRLADLLDYSNSQLYLIDEIVKIFTEEAREGLDLAKDEIPTRKSFLKGLQTRFPVPQPTVSPVSLETPSSDDIDYCRGHRDVVHIVHYDFLEQWNDLHQDNQLWGDLSCLCVDPNNPFSGSPSRQDGMVDEVVDGHWYRSTRAYIIQNLVTPGEPYLIDPQILYADKTGTDQYQRWGVEPFLFTSALLNRQARNKASSWRPLGFLPDLDLKSSAAKKRSVQGKPEWDVLSVTTIAVCPRFWSPLSPTRVSSNQSTVTCVWATMCSTCVYFFPWCSSLAML